MGWIGGLSGSSRIGMGGLTEGRGRGERGNENRMVEDLRGVGSTHAWMLRVIDGGDDYFWLYVKL